MRGGVPCSLVSRTFLKLSTMTILGMRRFRGLASPHIYPDNPLGPFCTLDGSALGRRYGRVIKISQIDPTPIMVEHDTSNDTYIMIRDCGYSTRR